MIGIIFFLGVIVGSGIVALCTITKFENLWIRIHWLEAELIEYKLKR